MIVHADDDTIELLEKNRKIISEAVDNIQSTIHISFQKQKECDNKSRLQNPYIVKSVIKYMANGLNKTDAVILTAQDFQTDIARIDVVYNGQKKYMSAVNLYAKRYLCEKLRQAGFIAKDIALVLGISENHVFKLLRCKADFWFLE